MSEMKYVLITPARNEEEFIEKTIKSVINQTILPIKWIIVSDGSTDDTADIVREYAGKHDFIDLISTIDESERVFSSKVRAFNLGYEKVKNFEYNFIGNLDADIACDEIYFEKILEKFQHNSKLGIAGGDRYDLVNNEFIKVTRSSNSVAGAVQLFSRECFAAINGYRPLDYGGIDAVTESMARFEGWDVKTFSDVIFYHYRRTGTAEDNILKARYNSGIKEYLIGYHPLFEIFRIFSKIHIKPYLVGSLAWFYGFILANIKNIKRPVPADFVKKLRKEQINRIKASLKKFISP